MLDPIVPYSTAKGYVQSAYIIMASEDRFRLPDDTPLYLSFKALCGFAVELYLKSFLLHKGYTESALRGIGHDLEELYRLCASAGLHTFDLHDLLAVLAEQHKKLKFRYMSPSTTYIARDLSLLFAEFSALDIAVHTAIGASAKYGKEPGASWHFPADRSRWRFPTP